MKNTSFPDRLREARIARGMSQTDLAGMTDIAPGQVNRYEAAKNMPRPHIMAKLAASLGVSYDWLCDGIGERDTGISATFSNEMDVITRHREGGGMGITISLNDELAEIFAEEAQKRGLPLDVYLKEALLEAARLKAEELQTLTVPKSIGLSVLQAIGRATRDPKLAKAVQDAEAELLSDQSTLKNPADH